MDVKFVFKKEGYHTLERTQTIHEKGVLHPLFPNRIWFDSSFIITIQDSDGIPLEGVNVTIGDKDFGDTDMNGKLEVIISKE